jgi:hypothetical protein
MSKKLKLPIKNVQYEDEVSLKDEFKNKFKEKKQTQQQAHERRQMLREIRENRDWN